MHARDVKQRYVHEVLKLENGIRVDSYRPKRYGNMALHIGVLTATAAVIIASVSGICHHTLHCD